MSCQRTQGPKGLTVIVLVTAQLRERVALGQFRLFLGDMGHRQRYLALISS